MPLTQTLDDFLPGQVFRQANRGGPQSRMDGMLSDHRDVHVQDFMPVVQTEADAFQPQAFHIIGPQVSFRIETVEEYARRGQFGHFGYPRVIQVENGNPVAGQGLHQFRFAAEDGFLRPRPFSVDRADVGDNANFWLGNFAQ